MNQTIIGLFNDFGDARQVIRELTEEVGLSEDNISIVANEEKATAYAALSNSDDKNSDAISGAATGAIVGGTTGLLASLAAVAIPGIGPVLAAGPISHRLEAQLLEVPA